MGGDLFLGRGLAVQQRLDFELVDDVLEFSELVTCLLGGVLVVHLDSELHENLEVVDALLDLGDALELVLTVAESAGDLLRVLHIVPEIGSGGGVAEPGDLLLERVDIDDGLDIGEGRAQGLDVGGHIEFKHDAPAYRRRASCR